VLKLSPDQIISQAEATPGAPAALMRIGGLDVLFRVRQGKPDTIRIITPRDNGGADATLWFSGNNFFLEPPRTVVFDAHGQYLYTVESHETGIGQTMDYYRGATKLYSKSRVPGKRPYSEIAREYVPGKTGTQKVSRLPEGLSRQESGQSSSR
jgi:hypothetical protein